ncbi:hypothetical protein [Natronomonas sp. EA1]|uniref:hypothetical protein n=1 Tax=Natronomonas sp. EA1 TaxID=3421655 RepID=UPI003EBBA879
MTFEVEADTRVEMIYVTDAESGEQLGRIFSSSALMVPATGDELELGAISRDADGASFDEDTEGPHRVESRKFSYVEITRPQQDDDTDPETALGTIVELVVSEVE